MTVVAQPAFHPGLKPAKKKREEFDNSQKPAPTSGTAKPSVIKNSRKVGGGYTAIDNADGSFDLIDVPIFAELPAGAKRNKEAIGKAWMEAAIAKNKLRESEGHLPPTHIFHSDEPSCKPIYAGKLRLKKVDRITYEGRKLWAVFADIIEIPAEVFSVIEKGRIPFRSVEVHAWDNPEIDSLALMPTDVPFFRMAMTTVSRIIKRGADMFREKLPAIWSRTVDKEGSLILFRFEDKPMEPKDHKPEEEKFEDKDEEKKKDGDGHPNIEFEDEEKEGAEENLEDAPPAAPMAPPAPEPPPAWIAPMMQLLSQMAQAMGIQPAGAPAAPAAPMAVEPPQGTEDLSPVAGMKAKDTKEKKMDEKNLEKAVLKAMTPLVAKVDSLEKESAEAKKEKAVRFRMEKAEKELQGTAMSDVVRKHLLKLAETQDEKDFEEAVDTFKKSLPVEPPENMDAFEAALQGGRAPELNDEIAKFTAKHSDPKAAAWAKKELAAYREYCRGMGSKASMTAEEWLETNMRANPTFA